MYKHLSRTTFNPFLNGEKTGYKTLHVNGPSLYKAPSLALAPQPHTDRLGLHGHNPSLRFIYIRAKAKKRILLSLPLLNINIGWLCIHSKRCHFRFRLIYKLTFISVKLEDDVFNHGVPIQWCTGPILSHDTLMAYSDRTLTGPGTGPGMGCILSQSVQIATGRGKGTSMGTNYKIPFLGEWQKWLGKPFIPFPLKGTVPFPLVVWNIPYKIQ